MCGTALGRHVNNRGTTQCRKVRQPPREAFRLATRSRALGSHPSARIAAGPFASAAGVGRAEPEWAALNKVTGVCGVDSQHAGGVTTDAPIDLGPEVMSGDLSGLADKEFDLLIVGAGLSGAVLAERCSKELGMSSLILDCRDHIGGNCYDYIDEHGIRASKYGAHLFHTKFERVWDYVQQEP